MASLVLQAAPQVDSVYLNMPNLHFLPCTPAGARFEDDVYVATSEPHGARGACALRDCTGTVVPRRLLQGGMREWTVFHAAPAARQSAAPRPRSDALPSRCATRARLYARAHAYRQHRGRGDAQGRQAPRTAVMAP
jgi:hypothetical protein